jgi:A/G-specific adenine glycosylase
MLDEKIKKFQREIWDFYKKNRREMPWRNNPDPYCVLISEIMLQQTQVDRVRIKYAEFLEKFPTFEALAAAPQSAVIAAWQGLGYNRRALMLKRLSERVVDEHKGSLPNDRTTLLALPGIGPATAGSLSAFAFNLPVPFIETNIRRVFIYHFFPKSRAVPDENIMKLVAKTLPQDNSREWYYALMDYGTYLAKMVPNPNRKSKIYTKQSKFEGSDRQIRGEILRRLLAEKKYEPKKLMRDISCEKERFDSIIKKLVTEGFIVENAGVYSLVS